MNKLLKVMALIGLAGTVYAGPSSPPAGNYITNVSTIAAKPAFNVSSGTVRDQLKLSYISTGSVLGLNSAGVVVSTTVSGGGGATLSIPNTAVAVGTSSNTVTGDATTFSWTPVYQTLTIGGPARSSFVQGSHAIEILNAELSGGRPNLLITTGFSAPVGLHIVNSSGSVTLGVSEFANPLVGAGNGYIGTEGAFYLFPGGSSVGFGIDASSATFFTKLQAKGTVDISSGILCGGAAGTLGQFMTSGGAGGPCTWATGSSGGSSSLAVTTGTSTGYSSVASSPTAVLNFDGSTFNTSLTGSATAYITMNASSVTLQGNNLAATYLTNSSATATYLNQSSATATYLNQTAAAATYLTQANAATTYLAQSSATSTYLQNSSATVTYLSTITAAGSYLAQSSATATYLQNSSATAVYLSTIAAASTYLTQSSATSTYLQNSSATAVYLSTIAAASAYLTQSSATVTYLQGSSATATYLNQTAAAAAYLTQSSATSTYLQNSSATATYLNKTDGAATYLTQSSATATYANKSVFATTTSTGVLSATDWTTFNGKQAAGAYLTAVAVQGPIQGNGTAGSPLFTSTATATSTGSLTSTDWNTFNNKQASGAYLTAVTAQAPISGNGTAGSPLITSTATATSTGSLTATDWSTFNSKGVGTITGITTQNGLIGGGTSGALTISVSSVSLSTQVVGNLPTANLNGGSGATSSTFWRGDGSWQSVTGSGDNLGNHVATTTLNMANFGISKIGTANSSFSASGMLTLNAGLNFGAPNTQTAAYTVTSTDTLVRANATSAGLTVNLPAASANTGQVLTISKVDTTTGTITIKGNGTDLIVGTGTIRLNAFTQTAAIISDGVSNWLPWGAGIQTTPAWVGTGFTGTTANTMSVASQTVCQAFYTPVPVAIDSMTVHIGSIGNLLDMGIYDTDGTTGKLLASTGQFAQSAGRYNRALTSVLQLPPGQYYACIVANNGTTPTVTSLSYASTNPPAQTVCGAAGGGGSIPLATTITWSGCTASRTVLYGIWAHTVGGNL